MTAGTSNLTIDISTSMKGIPTNSALIGGAEDLVLIDTCLTVSDARALAGRIRDTGRTLREIHITHAHPDHYFGIAAMGEAFPDVEVYAHPGTVDALQEWPAKVRHWAEVFGGEDLPWEPREVTARDDRPIELGGEQIEVIDLYRTEAVHMRIFYIPAARTMIAGDFVYHGMHLLTAEVGHLDGWISELERVREGYDVERVIMGHGPLCGPEVFDHCIEYLSLKRTASAPGVGVAEVARQMRAACPDLFVPEHLYWTRGPSFGFTGPASVGMPEDLSPEFEPPPAPWFPPLTCRDSRIAVPART